MFSVRLEPDIGSGTWLSAVRDLVKRYCLVLGLSNAVFVMNTGYVIEIYEMFSRFNGQYVRGR